MKNTMKNLDASTSMGSILDMNDIHSGQSATEFEGYIDANREQLIKSATKNGFLLLRNTATSDEKHFNKIVTQHLKIKGFTKIPAPGALLTRLRDFYSKVFQKVSYRNFVDSQTIKLGVPEKSIQGPHIEGGLLPSRSRYIVLYCKEASSDAANTAIYDLAKAYDGFDAEEKEKYLHAKNKFSFNSGDLSFLERILATLMGKIHARVTKLSASRIRISFNLTPAVIAHPDTGQLCVQPWPFFNNTAQAVHDAASDILTDRNFSHADSTASMGDSVWDLATKDGEEIEWTQKEKYNYFRSLFKSIYAHQWQEGDIIIIDNMRCGHGRMEGSDTLRSIFQIQSKPVNVRMFAPKG